MKPITYKEYMNIIPQETAKFVNILISALTFNSNIPKNAAGYPVDCDYVLYKALISYKSVSEENKNLLSKLGFYNSFSIKFPEIDSQNRNITFSNYYDYFTPFNNKEYYHVILPEDILRYMFKRIDDDDVFEYFSEEYEEIDSSLKKLSASKREEIIKNIGLTIYKDLNINTINYIETVTKIYEYLIQNIDDIKGIDITSETIQNLSFLLGIYYYNAINDKDGINEKDVLISSIYNITGIDLNKIIKTFNLNENISAYYKSETAPNIITLKYILNMDKYLNFNNKSNIKVYDVLFKKITDESSSISYKKLLSLLGSDTNDIIKSINDARNYNSEKAKIDDMFNGTSSNITELLHRVNQIYTYLLDKKESFNSLYIKDDNDLITLSLLLYAYEEKNYILEYLNDKNLSLDKILEILNLPKKEKLFKEINSTLENENNIIKFKNIVFNGYSSNKSKENVTNDSVFENLSNKNYSNSNLIHNIYYDINNEKLPDVFRSNAQNYVNKKEYKRQNDLKEELFKNIDINVFNYLEIVSDYYNLLKNHNLSEADITQVSIILAALKFDKDIEDYLSKYNIDYEKINKSFKLDYSYKKSEFNIDAINTIFRKYIFDRDDKDITVHSIFENAFDERLTNSLTLRKLLNKYNTKPEDFLNIDDKIKLNKEEKIKLEKQIQIETNKHQMINYNTLAFMENVFRLYEYFKNNNITSSLVSNEEELKNLCTLIVTLYSMDEYNKYFNNNDITLEYILSKVNISENDLTKIFENRYNDETILKYQNYFIPSKDLDNSTIINILLKKESSLIEKIVKDLNKDFKIVQDEITLQKEKELTNEERIEKLSKEEVLPLTGNNIIEISNYGNNTLSYIGYLNNELYKLSSNDTISIAVNEINNALNGVIVNEKIEPKKQNLWESFWNPYPEEKTIRKYHPEKLSELKDSINQKINNLLYELEGYDLIKRFVSVELLKLDEHLTELNNLKSSIKETDINHNGSISDFTQSLENNTFRQVLDSKIQMFEKNNIIMKNTLLSIHTAIINHIQTINSLITSRDSVIPLIASEMMITIGNKSEKDALDLTDNLLNLCQNLINKNDKEVIINMQRLKGSTISENDLNNLTLQVDNYLNSIQGSNNLIKQIENMETDDNNKLVLK